MLDPALERGPASRRPSRTGRRYVCPRCSGRKDFYAEVCRGCKRPDEWPKLLLGKKGAEHPAWKGGRLIDEDGYVLVYDPDYCFRRPGTPYVREHVRIIEDELGRQLRDDEVVHHRDEDRQNNVRSNLVLTRSGPHSRHHRLLRPRPRDARGRFARAA